MDFIEVIDFWFTELEQKQWWSKDDKVDREILERFEKTYWAATRGELAPWRNEDLGRLAEIIVLDQFSRNMFRNKPQAFTYDCIALTLAQEAWLRECHLRLEEEKAGFLYMPYMHSESKAVHEQAEGLFRKLGREGMLDFELRHKKIIDRFGRYPHRNQVLGRESTPEEIEFLKQPGSSF